MAFLTLPLLVFHVLLMMYCALFLTAFRNQKKDDCINWYPILDKFSGRIVPKMSVFLQTYPRNCHSPCSGDLMRIQDDEYIQFRHDLFTQRTTPQTLDRMASIDRFHSRDKNLDNRCYAAILVYRNVNKPKSVPRKSNGVVYGCWMWKQKRPR